MKISKTILKIVLTVVVSIFVGTILMFGIYSLPTNRIKNNIESSASLFTQEENKVENWVGYLRYGVIDNSTDSTMLNIAGCRAYDSVIENSLLNPRYKTNGSTINIDSNPNAVIINYSRYWHGYLLYLVPMLMFTSFGGIRMIVLCAEFLLALLLLYKLSKINVIYMFAYAVTLLFINPITVALNLQNADIYILTLIFSIFILYCNNWLKKNDRYYVFFTIIGISTSFFDFLTYPIVTLGISLLTVLLVSNKDYKANIKNLVIYSFCWIFGYAGMWAGKWIISSILTDENTIKDAIDSIILRSSNMNNVGTKISFIDAIKTFKESIHDTPMVLLAICSILIIIGYVIINKNKIIIGKDNLVNLLPYIMVFAIPYVWAFVVRNHFATHQFLEYRTMAISVLAKLLILIKLFDIKNEHN